MSGLKHRQTDVPRIYKPEQNHSTLNESSLSDASVKGLYNAKMKKQSRMETHLMDLQNMRADLSSVLTKENNSIYNRSKMNSSIHSGTSRESGFSDIYSAQGAPQSRKTVLGAFRTRPTRESGKGIRKEVLEKPLHSKPSLKIPAEPLDPQKSSGTRTTQTVQTVQKFATLREVGGPGAALSRPNISEKLTMPLKEGPNGGNSAIPDRTERLREKYADLQGLGGSQKPPQLATSSSKTNETDPDGNSSTSPGNGAPLHSFSMTMQNIIKHMNIGGRKKQEKSVVGNFGPQTLQARDRGETVKINMDPLIALREKSREKIETKKRKHTQRMNSIDKNLKRGKSKKKRKISVLEGATTRGSVNPKTMAETIAIATGNTEGSPVRGTSFFSSAARRRSQSRRRSRSPGYRPASPERIGDIMIPVETLPKTLANTFARNEGEALRGMLDHGEDDIVTQQGEKSILQSSREISLQKSFNSSSRRNMPDSHSSKKDRDARDSIQSRKSFRKSYARAQADDKSIRKAEEEDCQPRKTYYIDYLRDSFQQLDSPYLAHFSTTFNIFVSQIGKAIKQAREEREGLTWGEYIGPGANSTRKYKFFEGEYDKNKITLLFDLDETFVHCDLKEVTKSFDKRTRIIITNGYNQKSIATLNARPYVHSFLERLSPYFEIGVFTAAVDSYAQQVVRYLDPERKYIKLVLSRNDCVEVYPNIFVKDLRIIKNRPLEKLFLIDNCAYSYGFQLSNGIPIVPYHEGRTDAELRYLESYLHTLRKQEDPLRFNKETFMTEKFSKVEDSQDAISLITGL